MGKRFDSFLKKYGLKSPIYQIINAILAMFFLGVLIMLLVNQFITSRLYTVLISLPIIALVCWWIWNIKNNFNDTIFSG